MAIYKRKVPSKKTKVRIPSLHKPPKDAHLDLGMTKSGEMILPSPKQLFYAFLCDGYVVPQLSLCDILALVFNEICRALGRGLFYSLRENTSFDSPNGQLIYQDIVWAPKTNRNFDGKSNAKRYATSQVPSRAPFTRIRAHERILSLGVVFSPRPLDLDNFNWHKHRAAPLHLFYDARPHLIPESEIPRFVGTLRPGSHTPLCPADAAHFARVYESLAFDWESTDAEDMEDWLDAGTDNNDDDDDDYRSADGQCISTWSDTDDDDDNDDDYEDESPPRNPPAEFEALLHRFRLRSNKLVVQRIQHLCDHGDGGVDIRKTFREVIAERAVKPLGSGRPFKGCWIWSLPGHLAGPALATAELREVVRARFRESGGGE